MVKGTLISKQNHTVRFVKGLGYDWHVVQLGEATEATTDATRLDFKKLRIDASMAWNIIRIGIPALLLAEDWSWAQH